MPHQPRLIKDEQATYQVDDAEKVEYVERLHQKLQDPKFRQIEGFPIGEDEDILALSDPPFYTACPNPFLPEIIEQWQAAREVTRQALDLPLDGENGDYQREPFASDVSEGKGTAIYNAHSYHTKVPHKAIMRYILHYTDPGDLIFDGFCGTGMTGVAAQFCGNKAEIENLGYQVKQGVIYDNDEPIGHLGVRKTVLNDLSSAATFIAYNYNNPVDVTVFELEARELLQKFDDNYGWMYETWHPHCDHSDRALAQINYTVWSEVFSCPHCGTEIIFFEEAVDKDTFRVNKKFPCPECKATVEKRVLDRYWETHFDESLKHTQQFVKFVPVLINYQLGKHRFEKKPDQADIELIEKIDSQSIDAWYPIHEMPDGERKGKDGYHLKGISHLHHFYFQRSLLSYANLWHSAKPNLNSSSFITFFVQGSGLGFTKMNRYSANHYSQVNRYFSGTLFVGSLISEVSPKYSMMNKLKRLSRLQLPGQQGNTAITCQSTTQIKTIPNNTFDYIFVDPPFGNNLHYSELNFFWEAWLKVLTSREPEAVMDKGRDRTLFDYQDLMYQAFLEIFRVLKPGRWMTVEFHNSQNRVWNAIQEALLRAGFVVADVRTLDKKQETYKQSIQKLVKADLVISAYKPLESFETRFINNTFAAQMS